MHSIIYNNDSYGGPGSYGPPPGSGERDSAPQQQKQRPPQQAPQQ